jgi:16S rRNA (cytosine1402-N4)-methyltransferase
MLNHNGRLVVITYHSLEDRVVKNFMKTGNFDGVENKDFYGNVETPFRLINRKGSTPGEEEVANNNRARSARLRIAEKI